MKPGDTIDLNEPLRIVIHCDDNKAYYALMSNTETATIAICLCSTSDRHITVLKIYHEGPWDLKIGLLESLILHLPIEDMPVLALHPTPGVRRRALRRLAQTPTEVLR
jgi:hypothetical protein